MSQSGLEALRQGQRKAVRRTKEAPMFPVVYLSVLVGALLLTRYRLSHETDK